MSRPDADFFSLSQLYKCLLAALAMAAFTLAAPAPALADGIVATDACGSPPASAQASALPAWPSRRWRASTARCWISTVLCILADYEEKAVYRVRPLRRLNTITGTIPARTMAKAERETASNCSSLAS